MLIATTLLASFVGLTDLPAPPILTDPDDYDQYDCTHVLIPPGDFGKSPRVAPWPKGYLEMSQARELDGRKGLFLPDPLASETICRLRGLIALAGYAQEVLTINVRHEREIADADRKLAYAQGKAEGISFWKAALVTTGIAVVAASAGILIGTTR